MMKVLDMSYDPPRLFEIELLGDERIGRLYAATSLSVVGSIDKMRVEVVGTTVDEEGFHTVRQRCSGKSCFFIGMCVGPLERDSLQIGLSKKGALKLYIENQEGLKEILAEQLDALDESIEWAMEQLSET